jgi:hypothetical protein
MPITSSEARGFLDRWELVRQAELVALRSATADAKLLQLATLMELRRALGG